MENSEVSTPEIAAEDEEGQSVAGDWSREVLRGTGVQAGYVNEPSEGVEPIDLTEQHLLRNTLVTGAAGYGKTELLQNIATQTADCGHGVAFVDPRGTHATDLYQIVPEHRLDDVVLIDASSTHSLGFDYLSTISAPGAEMFEKDIESVINGLFSAFLYDSSLTYDQVVAFRVLAESYLRNTVEPSLDGLVDAFTDRDTRARVLEQSADSEYVEDGVVEAVGRHLDDVITDDVARLAFDDEGITAADALDDGSIVLLSLSDSTATSRIWQLFLGWLWRGVKRRAQADSVPTPFQLIVDEYQSIGSSTGLMPRMQAQSRAGGVGITLSVQHLNQIPLRHERHILGNTGTIAAFNPANPKHAKKLAYEIGDLSAEELLNISRFTCLLRRPGESDDPVLTHTFPPLPRRRDDVVQILD